MIPKVIHYCWFGGNALPNDARKCIESWKKMCPDYQIIRWDEGNFDVNKHPFSKAAYEAKAWAFVSDYVRLKVVYDNGGIYLDTDVELLKNLDCLLNNQCYIGVQQAGLLCTTGLGFGAEKYNPVVHEMLEMYDKVDFSNENKYEIACPYLNDKVIKKLGYLHNSDEPIEIDGTLILPERYLDPVAPGNDMKYLKCKDTISIHHYSASWMGRGVKLRRKIIRLIGQKRVSALKQFLKIK